MHVLSQLRPQQATPAQLLLVEKAQLLLVAVPMVWMGHQEVAELEPRRRWSRHAVYLIRNIHSPLVYYNEFTELELVLAESYDVSDDGLTYTFKLQEGVPFHDGKEFTSADVKYTYDFYRNPDNATVIVGDFEGIGCIDTPDDYTVVVNMDTVNAASLANWARVPYRPGRVSCRGRRRHLPHGAHRHRRLQAEGMACGRVHRAGGL